LGSAQCTRKIGEGPINVALLATPPPPIHTRTSPLFNKIKIKQASLQIYEII